MDQKNSHLGKILYGVFFIIIFPLLLWLWGKYTSFVIDLPPIKSEGWGICLSFLGMGLLLWAMYSIIVYGKGLPMNAYPPAKLVRRGPYYFIRHPIYWGFGIFLAGVSIYLGSASALWLVTPVTILGMIALVMGYEKINLLKRFEDYPKPVFISLPEQKHLTSTWQQRIIIPLLILLCWLIGSNIIWFLYSDHQYLIEIIRIKNIPSFLQLSCILNLTLVLLLLFIPLKQSDLREWVISSLLVTGLIIFLAIVWPEIGAQYFPKIDSFSGLGKMHILGIPFPVFFSFHPSWMLLVIRLYARKLIRNNVAVWIPGLIIVLVNIGISRAPVINLLFGLFFFWISIRWKTLWLFLRNISERIANSWQEWEYGRIRIINHGFYAGAGAFIGTFLAGLLVGKEYIWAGVIYMSVILVFSALWAQVIEGSEKLKRPFGYYGALVGVIFASLIIWPLGYNIWVVIGISSVVMPWVQAIGRLRCLVNGCCHGSPVKNPEIGIIYTHSRSRVGRISDLKGERLHPTPLYSLIWLFFTGCFLLSFWIKEYSYLFIAGMYGILTGIGRFVEEAYRGEKQTPILNGLRLYQWTALISVIIGAVLTTIDIPRLNISTEFGFDIIIGSFVIGLFTFFIMGVDFSSSNARFHDWFKTKIQTFNIVFFTYLINMPHPG